jgi:hypothetical protein
MKFKSDPVKLENRFDSVRLDMFLQPSKGKKVNPKDDNPVQTCNTLKDSYLHNNAGATNNLPGLALRINLA